MLEKVKPELLGKYPGEWVIICNNKIIAHHQDLRAIKDKIATCRGTPLISKFPKEAVWLF
jgi:hypothetical protein